MAAPITCTFCSKGKKEVKKLFAGPTLNKVKIYICNECINSAYQCVNEIKPKEKSTDIGEITPETIKAHLDEYVIGQESAKKVLSVAVYNHYKRINNPSYNGVELDKSNIIMVGPSGTGKTLLVSTIAKILNLPYVVVNSTSLTESGYSGKDVESIFERLYISAGSDLELAQKGIVFIDEIDKKSKKVVHGSDSRDVSGEGVQQALLRLVEGELVQIEHSESMFENDTIDFNTKDVLFIASGAFIGIDEIIQKRVHTGNSIGFGSNLKSNKMLNVLEYIDAEDLHEYGMIREFVGRFPIIAPLHDLDVNLLSQVLTETKNCLTLQYASLFSMDGVDLTFDKDFIGSVSRQCISKKVGARGLRSIMEKVLQPVQYELPSLKKKGIKKIHINSTGEAICQNQVKENKK